MAVVTRMAGLESWEHCLCLGFDLTLPWGNYSSLDWWLVRGLGEKSVQVSVQTLDLASEQGSAQELQQLGLKLEQVLAQELLEQSEEQLEEQLDSVQELTLQSVPRP